MNKIRKVVSAIAFWVAVFCIIATPILVVSAQEVTTIEEQIDPKVPFDPWEENLVVGTQIDYYVEVGYMARYRLMFIFVYEDENGKYQEWVWYRVEGSELTALDSYDIRPGQTLLETPNRPAIGWVSWPVGKVSSDDGYKFPVRNEVFIPMLLTR